jgi:hypothetical protein
MGDLSDLNVLYGFVVFHTFGCDPGTGCSIPEELPGHNSLQVFLEAKKVNLRS